MSKKSTKFSPEVRERAVRMVFEHRAEHPSQWAAIESVGANSHGTRQRQGAHHLGARGHAPGAAAV